jgi:flagellar hook protein FlgE
LTVAQATQNATMTGDFNTGGTVPTSVSDLTLGQPMYLSNGAGGVDPVNPPTSTTLLTNVTDATGAPMFQSGDVISLTGEIGPNGSTIPVQSLTVTPTTTLGDLQSFMTGSLGINTTAGVNGAIATPPGVTVPATGNNVTLTVDGNPGADNDISLDSNSLTIDRGGTTLTPFTWTKNSSADGESVETSMTVYDSLGTPIPVNVTAVLQSLSSTGSTWQVFATSPGGTATGANINTAVGLGTLTYNTSGQLTSTTEPTLTINRSNSGAQPNLTVALNFNNTTALSGTTSQLASTNQDGSPPGTLTTFSIGNDGTISGSFSNGLSRTMGQVAVATFQNNEGLIAQGNNNFIAGPNSGSAVISAPGQLSAGTITAGALELSNVDLSAQFVQLISASTAFSGSSHVITTANQLLQELLSATR